MLQIVFIAQMDSVVVVTKIKEAYADILKMNVVLSQNINVNIVRNLCSGKVHYKSIKLFALENMFFNKLLSFSTFLSTNLYYIIHKSCHLLDSKLINSFAYWTQFKRFQFVRIQTCR